jgi:glycosyltransferase involved in cell wall biosynthesis
MSPIRLLALVQKAPGIAPNQRFRHEQWAPYLQREHGIELTFVPFESPELTRLLYEPGRRITKARLVLRDTARRWATRCVARQYDGVVVLREAAFAGGALLERAITASGVPLIYDFDDAIWRWTPGVNGLLSLARAPWKVGAICRFASAVTVGNEYLAAYARKRNGNVFVVRTSIDVDRFPVLPAPDGDQPFTLVWTGSHSTLPHLEMIRPALEQLGQRVRVRLRVVCDIAPEPLAHVPIDFVPWSARTEAEDLAVGHVGLMPLPDTAFTRGKCGCKALQYMAIGRPAVVSPVGINREIVRDEENGLHAVRLTDWTTQLERLAREHALRDRLGAAAARTVRHEGYTAEASASAFAHVAKQVLAGRRNQ